MKIKLFSASNQLYILFTMILLTLPALLYFSQRNNIGDIRNRAAEVYGNCTDNGYQCVPSNVECTDAGGTVISSLTCSPIVGVCCSFPITPTSTPRPMTPTPTPLGNLGELCRQLGGYCYDPNSCFCNGIICVPDFACTCEVGVTCQLPGAQDCPAPELCVIPLGPGTPSATPTGGGGGGTATPTRTPTQPQTPPTSTATTVPGQCLNIKIYNTKGVQLDPNTLRPGDQVFLAVAGSPNTTKAHFRVNGAQLPNDTDTDPNWSETTLRNALNEFIIAYTIPSQIVHILVEAEVFANGNWY